MGNSYNMHHLHTWGEKKKKSIKKKRKWLFSLAIVTVHIHPFRFHGNSANYLKGKKTETNTNFTRWFCRTAAHQKIVVCCRAQTQRYASDCTQMMIFDTAI